LRQRETSAAENLINRALRAAPDNPDVYTAIGRLRSRENRFEAALTAYERAIALDPRTFLAHMDMGDLLLGTLDRPLDAVAAYKQAIDIEPDYAVSHFALGMAYLKASLPKMAIASIEDAATLAPTDPSLPHAIGRIHASNQDFDRAIEYLDKSLNLSPSFLPARIDRADIRAETGMDAEAASDYEQVLEYRPEDGVTRLKLGMIYQRLDRTDDAVSAYKSALQRNSDLSPAYNNLAMIEVRRNGDLEQALRWARRAVELEPHVPQFNDTLGTVYEARGDTAAALEALKKAAALPPPQADILFHLGQVLESTGENIAAADAYRRALELMPDNVEANEAIKRLDLSD
jgi:superkiller protein 3